MAKILITGAGGFIGSHVVEAFLDAGHAVTALARYNSMGRRGWLDDSPLAARAEGEGRLRVVLGDVTDAGLMDSLMAGQEIVAHLAALIGIPYSYAAPASYVAVNVGGTLNLLEAARRHRARRVVVTSTSEVYGRAVRVPMDEEHPLRAQSPYSASKIAADKLAESYFSAFDLPVVILRPFNNYGPRQSLRAVIPTILSQALSGAEAVALGSLAPKRDLLFVEDTARAFLLASEAKGIEGETIHVGSGRALSIEEIARRCLAAVGSRARLVTDPQRVRPEKSEVLHLECDPSKAARLLGWRPTIDLDEGLARTAEFLRRHRDQYASRTYGI
ncbi:MAG: GDP-mannose 4,6-dehydratase [Candidatus Sumerlaeota bacterium]|nr:GDP-mannose 4,6-dehydratase [Candidatus Sumerlaeota bacterium]